MVISRIGGVGGAAGILADSLWIRQKIWRAAGWKPVVRLDLFIGSGLVCAMADDLFLGGADRADRASAPLSLETSFPPGADPLRVVDDVPVAFDQGADLVELTHVLIVEPKIERAEVLQTALGLA